MSDKNPFFAGAGRCVIDPTPDMYPMATHFCIADAKYDSCFCRAIYLRSGEDKILFVIFEISDYPTCGQLKEKLSEATGTPVGNIIISFTHNHTSPTDELVAHRDPNGEYKEKREKFRQIELDAALSAASDAVRTARPAKIGFGTIDSYVNVNRDYENHGGYWVEAPNYAGFSDKTLAAMKITDLDGKLIAALLNHGTHSTCAFLAKDFDHQTKTSGNFSGIACKFAEAYYGGDAVVAWTAGAAGNQNPILSHGLMYEYPDGYITSVPYPDGVPYMQMEFVGRRHGADAVACINAINDMAESGDIVHEYGNAMLPTQRRTDGFEARGIRMGGRGLRDEKAMPLWQNPPVPDFTNVVEPDPEHPLQLDMHLVRIGDIAFFFTNGEFYAQLGAKIKETSPYRNTVVVTYSTSPSTSYILDSSSKDNKVFQAFNKVAPGKSDEIILNLEQELLKKANG